MASSFFLNMCITMEPPVRYDTYHAIGVPSFIVDFGTVNEPSASFDRVSSLFGASINRPAALAQHWHGFDRLTRTALQKCQAAAGIRRSLDKSDVEAGEVNMHRTERFTAAAAGPRAVASSNRVFIRDLLRVDVFPWCSIGIARGWRKCLLVIIAMFLLHRRRLLSGSLRRRFV